MNDDQPLTLRDLLRFALWGAICWAAIGLIVWWLL